MQKFPQPARRLLLTKRVVDGPKRLPVQKKRVHVGQVKVEKPVEMHQQLLVLAKKSKCLSKVNVTVTEVEKAATEKVRVNLGKCRGKLSVRAAKVYPH